MFTDRYFERDGYRYRVWLIPTMVYGKIPADMPALVEVRAVEHADGPYVPANPPLEVGESTSVPQDLLEVDR